MTLRYFYGWRRWLVAGAWGLLCTAPATAQGPLPRQWDRTLGGSEVDNLSTVQPTADGGYIVGGSSDSGVSGDKTEPSRGTLPTSNSNYDYWLVKLNAAGVKQWDRTLGGNQTDALSQVQQTADGGYILGGYSNSPASGDRSAPAKDGYWVVKVDALGVKQWDRAFGNGSLPFLNALQQTTDGGYILGGYSLGGLPQSPGMGDQSDVNQGDHDYWLIKLDANGTKQWDRAYGGSGFDMLQDVQQTTDGGYILGGTSVSGISGHKSEASRGSNDFWVIKVDAQGNRQWDRTYGGAGSDWLYSLRQTPDGGYILAGESASGVSGDKTQASQGGTDYWVVKLDGQGHQQWDRTLGGSGTERANAVRPSADGGFVVGGQSNSGLSGDKSQAGFGLADYWVVKLTAAGTKVWDAAYGGSAFDELRDLQPTADGGLVLGGVSVSGASCGKTQGSRGLSDYWVLKLGAAGAPLSTITGDTLLCNPGSAVLQVRPALAATAYQWSTGATTPTITVTQPGLYSVRTTLCDGTVTTAQLRIGQAAVTVRGPATVCAGGSATLTADAPGATDVVWSTGQRTATLAVSQAGTYTVTATFPGGCRLTGSHTIEVPQVVLSGDSLLCGGNGQQLVASAAGAGATYRWNTGATTASILVAQPGRYTVVATHANGCTSTATRNIRLVPALPPLTLGADTAVCEAEAVLLRAPGVASFPLTYRWSDNSTAPTLRVTQPGLYTVQVSTPCQTQTISRRVDYRSCVVIPTIVTANHDGANDWFRIQGLPRGTWKVQIFDRWGKQVWHSADYQNDWGADAAPGVYFYLLRDVAATRVYKGWVEVIR